MKLDTLLLVYISFGAVSFLLGRYVRFGFGIALLLILGFGVYLYLPLLTFGQISYLVTDFQELNTFRAGGQRANYHALR